VWIDAVYSGINLLLFRRNLLLTLLRRSRKAVPPKRSQISVTLDSVTSGKTALFIVNIQNGNGMGCMDLWIENFLQTDFKMSFLIEFR
jgi:hypothetical protein